MAMSQEELSQYAPIEIIITDIKQERNFQTNKWPSQPSYDNPWWCIILGEEVGEVNNALLEMNFGSGIANDQPLEHLYHELIQVAAVATAWAQKIRRTIDKAQSEREVDGTN